MLIIKLGVAKAGGKDFCKKGNHTLFSSLKFLSIIFCLIFVITSCNNFSNNDKISAADSIAAVDTSALTPKDDFAFTKILYNQFDYRVVKGGHQTYEMEFEVVNHTSSKITTFKIIGYLSVRFKNEATILIPTPFPKESEDDYANGSLPANGLTSDDPIDLNHPWLPNTTRTFDFKIGGWSYELPGTYFERTPEEVLFTYKYNAISVDGEYTNKVPVNIMGCWTEYQQHIGLR